MLKITEILYKIITNKNNCDDTQYNILLFYYFVIFFECLNIKKSDLTFLSHNTVLDIFFYGNMSSRKFLIEKTNYE